MPLLARELAQISLALRDPDNREQYSRLYAAQQALSWALEPDGFRRPYDTIKDIQEGLEDCSAPSHLPLS
jgi:hypothetical protein